ncbi:hypothetical protein GRJ2_001185400 [Grus japonensis]|uniref:Uncharacterized protein n=1 Tax=Grus japonensis TaxID=30415 RepID=A0ABC9WPK2_GRUJA
MISLWTTKKLLPVKKDLSRLSREAAWRIQALLLLNRSSSNHSTDDRLQLKLPRSYGQSSALPVLAWFYLLQGSLCNRLADVHNRYLQLTPQI